MPKTKPPLKELNFEQAMEELQGIISAMENEQRDLQDTLAMFERGKDLIARCQSLLDGAELKVRMLAEKAASSPPTED